MRMAENTKLKGDKEINTEEPKTIIPTLQRTQTRREHGNPGLSFLQDNNPTAAPVRRKKKVKHKL